MAARRIDTFDVLKGIGILLMIVGHSTGKIPYLRDFIFSFHMPLFFLVTGYFFKPAGFKDLLVKNSKRLLIPYLFTALLIMVHMLIYAWCQHRDVWDVLLIRLRATLLGSGAPRVFGMGPAIGALWFLCAMFWSYLWLNVALRTRFPFLFCMLLAAISFGLHKVVFLPLSFQPGLSGTLFLYVGYQIRQLGLLDAARIHSWNLPSFLRNKWAWVAVLFALWFTAFQRGKLEMSCDFYKLWYFDMIGAVAGCWFVYLLAGYVDRVWPRVKRVLRFFGRYSLVVLCFHQYETSNIPWHHLVVSSWGDYRLPMLWAWKIAFAVLMVQLVLHVPFLRRIFQIR